MYENGFKMRGSDVIRPEIEMRGRIKSPNCMISLDTESHTYQFETYYRKATNYVVMVALVLLSLLLLKLKGFICSNNSFSETNGLFKYSISKKHNSVE